MKALLPTRTTFVEEKKSTFINLLRDICAHNFRDPAIKLHSRVVITYNGIEMHTFKDERRYRYNIILYSRKYSSSSVILISFIQRAAASFCNYVSHYCCSFSYPSLPLSPLLVMSTFYNTYNNMSTFYCDYNYTTLLEGILFYIPEFL